MLDGDPPPAVMRSCVIGVDVNHVPSSADREGLAALRFDPDAGAPVVGGHRGMGLEEQVPLVEPDLFFMKMFEEHRFLFFSFFRKCNGCFVLIFCHINTPFRDHLSIILHEHETCFSVDFLFIFLRIRMRQ